MRFLYFVLAGIAGGILAGMGMGGGTLTLPILVIGLGVGQLTAQFANLAAFLPSGSTALFVHVKNGFVKKDGLLAMLIPAVASCVVCSFFAIRTGGDLLKKLFGGFLVVVALASLTAKVASKKQ